MKTFLLYHVPAFPMGVGFVGLAIAAAIGGLLLVRRSVALSTLEAHNDVAGFIIAVIGVVYAVLLAFVVISVWEQFTKAKEVADSEAVHALAVDRTVRGFGESARPVQEALGRYAQSVVDDEWKTMARHHRQSARTDARLTAVFDALQGVRVDSPQKAALYDDTIRRVNDLAEDRRGRLLDSKGELPAVLWVVLLAGGIITVGFTFFFGISNVWAQILMVTALAATISLSLFLVLALDLPFTGDLSVRPHAMQEALREFPHLAVATRP